MCKTHRLAHKAAARREGYVPKKRTKHKLSPPPVMGVSFPAPNLTSPARQAAQAGAAQAWAAQAHLSCDCVTWKKMLFSGVLGMVRFGEIWWDWVIIAVWVTLVSWNNTDDGYYCIDSVWNVCDTIWSLDWLMFASTQPKLWNYRNLVRFGEKWATASRRIFLENSSYKKFYPDASLSRFWAPCANPNGTGVLDFDLTQPIFWKYLVRFGEIHPGWQVRNWEWSSIWWYEVQEWYHTFILKNNHGKRFPDAETAANLVSQC